MVKLARERGEVLGREGSGAGDDAGGVDGAADARGRAGALRPDDEDGATAAVVSSLVAEAASSRPPPRVPKATRTSVTASTAPTSVVLTVPRAMTGPDGCWCFGGGVALLMDPPTSCSD